MVNIYKVMLFINLAIFSFSVSLRYVIILEKSCHLFLSKCYFHINVGLLTF